MKKPYGYVMKFESGIEAFNTEEYDLQNDKRISSIPLYTHLAELTDEEIDKAFEYANMQGYGSSYLEGLSDGFEMAKAILRKASER